MALALSTTVLLTAEQVKEWMNARKNESEDPKDVWLQEEEI